MLRNTDSSASSTTGTGLAPHIARTGIALPTLLLSELARPWRVIASQLLPLVEPLCTPEQRQALQRHAATLCGDKSPLANGDPSPAAPVILSQGVGHRSGVDSQ